MELNKENKARLFSQYWGQDIIHVNDFGWAGKTRIVDSLTIESDSFSKFSLILKPISSISDEDAIGVSKYCISSNPINVLIDRPWDNGVIEITSISEHSTWTLCLSGEDMYFKCEDYRKENDSTLVLAAYDFLRSKGYAIPFMGLSVREMIEAGWIKLKESNR